MFTQAVSVGRIGRRLSFRQGTIVTPVGVSSAIALQKRAGACRFAAGGAAGRKGNGRLSVEEALFLAKEAGYFTRREVQLQIVRSPPFSPTQSPFLIEDFFDVPTSGDVDQDEEPGGPLEGDAVDEQAQSQLSEADPVIHGTIQKHFNSKQLPRFHHNGKDWLVRAEGRGTRKRASAHAVLVRGCGNFKVNGETDMYEQWPLLYNRFEIMEPLKLTGTSGAYDVLVEVAGGGHSGKAGAVRLAIARALLEANPSCHDDLQRGYCLLEDTRQKMSKMPGKKGARASFTWSKR
eukprot:TRINITY_DN69955_c0_g1_i1.p1 TRINITY_DN69955_c0_g1~~TRINITY_DN69955_c0_g1_i1.p1  ORF type:complete len:291 (-),score=42.05 TRINITY_DN69955_c0_g1_i1:111-983(-)